MSTRHGNVIDYRGDPGMQNEDEEDKPKMGFMGGQFGAPGVRETKVVGNASEIDIPIKQSFLIAIGTAALLFAVYIILKIFIVDRADWSLFLGIVTIVGLPVLLIATDRLLKNQTPNFYAGIIRRFNSVIYGDNLAAFILMFLVIILIVYFIGEFYVSVIVPQMTYTLDQQAHVIALICIVLGWLVAYNPFKRFFTLQLTNSLRDSDSRYAVQSLLLEDEWRKRKAGIIDGEFSVADDGDSPKKSAKPVLVFGNVSRSKLPAPDNLHSVAMAEFLDGIRDNKWSTEERSWKGKRLERSGYSLTSIGDELRDSLIQSQWAYFNHPTQKHLGWKLYETPEITKRGYLQGMTGNASETLPVAPTEPISADTSDPTYWTPESEQGAPPPA